MFKFNSENYDEAFVSRGEKLYNKNKVHYSGKDKNGYSSFYVYGSEIYTVLVNAEYTEFSCNCPWRDRNDYCKHEIAVQLYLDDFFNGKTVKDGGIEPPERTFFAVEECKAEIQKINRRHKKNGFIEYEHAYAWGNELGELLYECEYLAESDEDIPLALQACVMILCNVIKNWDNIDDDGTLCPLLDDCFELLLKYKERVDGALKAEITKAAAKTENSDVAKYAKAYLKELN